VIVNFIGTTVTGHPIYDIITWEDLDTLWFLIGIFALLFISFHSLTALSIYRVGKDEGHIVLIHENVGNSSDEVGANLV